MDLLEWVFNVKTEYSWFLLFVKCFLCVDLTTGMSGHRWTSNQSIWLVRFSSRLESGNVPACQAGGLSHLNSEAPVMMKDAETRSRFLWISAQTEDIAALEVSFLNSVYLRRAATAVCAGRKDYWQDPVMEWKIEPAVTTVWELFFWNDRED